MSKKIIVLIDEEPWILEFFTDRLEDHFEVEIFQNANAGFEYINENTDIVLLDILMPLTDNLQVEYVKSGHNFGGSKGLFVLKYLRKKYPNLPIFCFTILSDNFTITKISEFGGKYVSKADNSLNNFIAELRSI